MQPDKSQQRLEGQQMSNERMRQAKLKYAKIPKQQRQNYIKKVKEIEQLPGPPPFIFKKQYQSEGKFKYKQYNLHYHYQQNSLHPKAILIIFHGMSSHSGGSGYFANRISEGIKDINVYAFDQMNFGRSQGPFRGLIHSLQDSVNQGQTFVEFILSQFQSKPKIFLCGSSFGGTIVFKMAINSPRKYQGIIFLAPALRLSSTSFKYLSCLAKFITWCLPPIRLMRQTQFKMGTRYNNKQAILADNNFYNDGIIPHSGAAVIKGTQQVSLLFQQFESPYILFQGGGDKMVDLFAPLDFEQDNNISRIDVARNILVARNIIYGDFVYKLDKIKDMILIMFDSEFIQDK